MLHCGMITLCTGTRDPHDKWKSHPGNAGAEAWRAFRAELDLLLRDADTYDLILGIEPEKSNVVSSAVVARRLVDELKSDRVKIVFDAANLAEGADLAYDLLCEFTGMIHAQGPDLNDFSPLLERLVRSGFAGPVIAHGVDESDAPAVASFLHALLQERTA